METSKQSQAAPTSSAKTEEAHRGGFLALRFVGGLGSSIVLALLSACAIGQLIHLLSKKEGIVLDQLFVGFSHNMAITTAVALLGLALAPWCLFLSVKKSLVKEPDFTKRVAYKVPLYITLALLIVAKVGYGIAAVSVVVTSLLSIGVSGAEIGDMYLYEFLPALAGVLVMGLAAYAVWQTARGKNMLISLSTMQATIAIVVGVALLIATGIAMHTKPNNSSPFPGTGMQKPSPAYPEGRGYDDSMQKDQDMPGSSSYDYGY